MLHLIMLAASVLFSAGAALAAEPAQPCPAKADSWQCLGVVEFHTDDKTTVRVSLFKNQELLAEIEEQGTRKRLLVTQPAGTELYFGLTADEVSQFATNPGKNPFAFFMEVVGTPAAALMYAFPAGPSSVPVQETKADVVIGRQHVTLIARRQAPGRIVFRLEFPSKSSLDGWLSNVRPEPLPGTYPIGDWHRASGPPLKLLQEARQAR